MTTVRRTQEPGGGTSHPPRLRPPAHRVARRAIAQWAIESALLWGLASGLAWGVAAWVDGWDGARRWDGLLGWLCLLNTSQS
ncbi:MAG: hypothetical protein IRY90_15715, partial [Actinomadura rubrobrunea]|nr:hypothetical protein [Actinomadura rubrobrunea]